ncbi:MAG: DNA-protecting protein DprA [Firmicutes bacterium]|nr:DNA-protecting protein DprA [Bacillota bacterium]
MSSQIAKKLYIAVRHGIIKTKAQFWKFFADPESINGIDIGISEPELPFSLICCFDDNFPRIPDTVKLTDKPFLFAFHGDITLLHNAHKNIAVIGTINQSEEIARREKRIIEKLASNGCNIVSGLAWGADTVAHTEALANGAKTIAFLPSCLDNIYPTANIGLANRIINSGGLIITEYVAKPNSKQEQIKRFIERDRLQAMFSKAVILIASHRKGEGDSGSRHAMQKAKDYGIKRFVMFDENTDTNAPQFGLNSDLLADGAEVLTLNKLCLL